MFAIDVQIMGGCYQARVSRFRDSGLACRGPEPRGVHEQVARDLIVLEPLLAKLGFTETSTPSLRLYITGTGVEDENVPSRANAAVDWPALDAAVVRERAVLLQLGSDPTAAAVNINASQGAATDVEGSRGLGQLSFGV